ncbi:C40 family peptidase [Kitasatospora sp. NPDC002040]|uniref:C40 family peptidase n=1 Tax=Kitasatospora sp. NPDC002040 TaxID=3154661 RepID=UPI00332DACDA
MARRILPTLLLTLAGLFGLLPAAGAVPAAPGYAAPADDPFPTADDIAAAQAEEAARAADTAAIEARLTAAQGDLDRAARETEQAVEAYNGAQAALTRARAEATRTAAAAAIAAAARLDAADRAAELAGETYRQGASGQLSALDALLGADGPRAVGAQVAAIDMAGTRTKEILDAATDAAAEADRTAGAAGAAEEAAVRAADAVRLAKEQAQARLAAQQAQVTEIAARREQLLGALAAARHTTVDLERQRREALEAIAVRAAEDAARAAAAAEAAAARPSADSFVETPWSAGGADAAIAFARSKIGLPYIWGGEGPAGYDCSGLTMMAWRRAGKTLTHFAADQYAESTPVSYAQLRPGDLVFWTDTGRARDIHHVALYIGNDQMIEAPRPGMAIKQASLWIMGRPDFYGRP